MFETSNNNNFKDESDDTNWIEYDDRDDHENDDIFVMMRLMWKNDNTTC